MDVMYGAVPVCSLKDSKALSHRCPILVEQASGASIHLYFMSRESVNGAKKKPALSFGRTSNWTTLSVEIWTHFALSSSRLLCLLFPSSLFLPRHPHLPACRPRSL